MRHILRYSLLFLAIAALVWTGCSDDESTDGGVGGSASSTGNSTTSSSSSTTGPQLCDGPPNGRCDINTEGCECVDCAQTAYCIEDLCTDDGICDLYDSCVCSDCDGDFFCADPGDTNCSQDGTCDSFTEGCNCRDCYTHDECTDNAGACVGGVADEQCDAPAEDCACTDCLGTVACVPCEVDDECGVTDPCFCVDCVEADHCTDSDACVDDGICAPLYEGCECADCAVIAQCGGTGGGGTGGGGSGGGGP